MGLKMPPWRHCMSPTRGRRDTLANTSVPVFRLQRESARWNMPEKEVLERAREDARQGKSPSTQAGEFVHEEIDHVKEGKHGARSTKQAIAIGLSKARRAGIKQPVPEKGSVPEKTRRQPSRESAKGQSGSE